MFFCSFVLITLFLYRFAVFFAVFTDKFFFALRILLQRGGVVKIKKVVKKAKRSGTSKIPLLRRALPVILVVVFSAVTLLAVLPLLPKKPLQSTPKHYQGVIELWNVESFEGGIGSRATWLTQRAAKFESTHEGLFVHVTTLTESQLEQKLAEGGSFDLISFSRGVGAKVQSYLQPYTASVAGIRENFLVSGQVGAKVYALPYYCGVYCLFARTSQLHQNADLLSTALVNTFTRKVGKHTYNLQPLICGFTPHNSPLTALAMSGGQGEIAPDESVTQYSAYEKFLANTTAVTLLGTQRDMYRLAKREQSGKIENLTFYPLYGYTDLVQYLGVSSSAGEKTQSCMEFLQFVASEQSQRTLVNVSMFSVAEYSLYTDERYVASEEGLSSAYVPNVFGDATAVANQRKEAISTLRLK